MIRPRHTPNETPCPAVQSLWIGVERLERIESNQEEGKGETEEREREMEQVEYEIDETPLPTNQP